MKKIKMLAVLSALAMGLSFFSCNNLTSGNSHNPGNNPEDNPGDNHDPNDGNEEDDTGLDGITIDGTKLNYTEEVIVIDSATTIQGSGDSDNTNHNNVIFCNGVTVTLSPFVMGKYEVTQELYKAI